MLKSSLTPEVLTKIAWRHKFRDACNTPFSTQKDNEDLKKLTDIRLYGLHVYTIRVETKIN